MSRQVMKKPVGAGSRVGFSAVERPQNRLSSRQGGSNIVERLSTARLRSLQLSPVAGSTNRLARLVGSMLARDFSLMMARAYSLKIACTPVISEGIVEGLLF